MDVFTDASFDEKNKIAGIGIVYVFPDAASSKKQEEFKQCINANNVHEAEAYAVWLAMRYVLKNRHMHCRLYTDSKRVMHMIVRGGKSDVFGLHELVAKLKKQGQFSFGWILGHQKSQTTIGHEKHKIQYNKLADKLSKEARENRCVCGNHQHINQLLGKECQHALWY